MEFLNDYLIAVIMGICLCTGYIIKNIIPGKKINKFIDKCNKIDFLVKKYDKTILKLPLTVIIVLLIFAFGVFVPAVFIGFFFDFQYRFEGEGMEDSKINEILMKISRYIKERKENRRDRVHKEFNKSIKRSNRGKW